MNTDFDWQKMVNRLAGESSISLLFEVVDRRVSIRSADSEIVKSFEHALSAWPQLSEADQDCDDIIYGSYVEDYPEILSITDIAPMRVIDDPSIGKISCYDMGSVFVFYQHKVGFLIQVQQNIFICLMDQRGKNILFGNIINVLNMAHVIVSDIIFRSGKILVHAGAVASDTECLLISGIGGAGKSTAVLRFVDAGWDFFGDDLVLVGRKEGKWTVWPYWRPVKVSGQTCRLIPCLSHIADSIPDNEKKHFDVDVLFKLRVPEERPIDRIYVINSSFSRSGELSLSEAFQMLSKTFMYYFSPAQAENMLETMLDICDSVPVYAATREDFQNLLIQENK